MCTAEPLASSMRILLLFGYYEDIIGYEDIIMRILFGISF